MPEAVKNKLAAAIEKAMNDDEMKKFVHNDLLVYDVQGPAEFTKFVKEQDTITEDWLKRLGFIKK